MKFAPTSLNINLDNGGLGDHIAALTAVNYIRENYPYVLIYLYVPNYFLDLAKHLIPGISIRPFSSAEKKWNKSFDTRLLSGAGAHTSMATHLIDHAFHVLVDKSPSIEHKNYLRLRANKIDIRKFALPERYVILTTGYTAIVRAMPARVTNELAMFLRSRNIIPVFLGSKISPLGIKKLDNGKQADIIGSFDQDIDYGVGIDLIDKTSLLEAAKIIDGAAAIVGLDNGLLHLAGLGKAPIVAAYTTVEPSLRLPIRNNKLGDNCYVVTPPESLGCRFCQSKFEYVYHDFRKCYMKETKQIEEIACTKSLKSEQFIEHLEKLLAI